MMMKWFKLIIFLFFYNICYSQPNCEAYKYFGDTLKYKACKKAKKAFKYYQFSKEFQEILDNAIQIDSTFAYAYREKSVAYLKSGDFIEWKKLMDKAVKYNAKENLGYRGWCHYQFFRNYKNAIEDIELLDNLVDYNIGYSQNGVYHLNIVKGLCYGALGQKEKAISIIESQLNAENHNLGQYDYIHLGVFYLENKDYIKALEAFKKQEEYTNLAENQFYTALVYKAMGNNEEKYSEYMNRAKYLYSKNQKMGYPYTTPMHKIYLKNIEKEIQLLEE